LAAVDYQDQLALLGKAQQHFAGNRRKKGIPIRPFARKPRLCLLNRALALLGSCALFLAQPFQTAAFCPHAGADHASQDLKAAKVVAARLYCARFLKHGKHIFVKAFAHRR